MWAPRRVVPFPNCYAAHRSPTTQDVEVASIAPPSTLSVQRAGYRVDRPAITSVSKVSPNHPDPITSITMITLRDCSDRCEEGRITSDTLGR